jgi:hypothetical protein
LLRLGPNRSAAAGATARHSRDGALGTFALDRRRAAERIDELERELQVKAEREFYCKRVAELEEYNRVLIWAATKYALWGQKLFRELAALIRTAPRRDVGTGSWM